MRVAAFVLLFAGPVALAAQQPKPMCASATHRAFDFWVGEWEVADTAGAIQAASSITLAADGCAVMEHWKPKSGPDGVSVNWVEPTDGKWHQQWVGGGGWIAAFVGAFTDGVMTLDATAPNKTPQGDMWARMTYQTLPDGRVRQLVLNSSDGRKSWVISFVGDYRRTRP